MIIDNNNLRKRKEHKKIVAIISNISILAPIHGVSTVENIYLAENRRNSVPMYERTINYIITLRHLWVSLI